MNALSFVASLALFLVPALSLGQGAESKAATASTDVLAGQCLSLSMSAPAKGMSIARTILNRKDASVEARIRALDCLGHAEAIAGKKDAASAAEEQALESLKAPDIPDAFRANILSNAGGVFTVLGDSHRAVALFEQANALGKEHHLPMAQIAALMNLAGLYSDTLNDPPRADAYYKQAIQLAKPLHRDDVYMYFNYGFNLLEMKKYDEALPVLNHIIQMSGKGVDLGGVRYRAKSELATIYLAKGNSSQALPLLHESIAGLRQLSDVEGEAKALLTLADFQLSKGDNSGALESAERVLTISKQSNFPQGQIAATHRLVRIYSTLNQPRKALELSESVNELEIADLKQQNYRGIASLEAELQNQASEYRNKELQSQLAIQTLDAKRANLIRNGLLALLLITLIFAGAFYLHHRRTHRSLQALSATDPLTGLLNRREIRRRLGIYQHTSGRVNRKQLTLLMIDIDHFKEINDQHGHLAGDQVLTDLAERLLSACRDEDLVTRLEGEEFLICLSAADPEDTSSMAERLRSVVASQPFGVSSGTELSITISIGFALYPFTPDGEDRSWRDTLHIADLALYAAKKSGRNAWVGVWGLGQHPGLTAQTVAADLRKAERAGQIRIRSNTSLVWE